MSRTIRSRRGFPVLCALLLAATIPVTGLMLRPTVLFLANFDADGDGGTLGATPMAQVGEFDDLSANDAFVVEVDPQGGGRLIATNTGSLAVLRGLVDTTEAQSTRISASIFIEPRRSVGHFYMRVSDEGDTPLIDVEFTPSGDIVVAGNIVMPYVPKVGYDIAVVLNDPIIGPTSASVSINGDDGTSASLSSIVIGWVELSVGSVDLVLPPSEVLGDFVVDDLLVLSSGAVYAPVHGGANAK